MSIQILYIKKLNVYNYERSENMKPKYQVIIEDIKSKILSGDYSIGEQIPTESVMQETYGVSRHTVRKAILELSNEGF